MSDFIGEYRNNYPDSHEFIKLFEENELLHCKGKIHDKYGVGVIDKDFKISTDLAVEDLIKRPNINTSVIVRYMNSLQDAINKYQEEYPDVKDVPTFFATFPQIQKYNPKEGFFGWHCERGKGNYNRVFAYLTYLNDVEDGGGTEFKYYDKIVKAEAGKTVIFPSDWTHTHRGEVSPTETKYILTGWLIADQTALSFV